MVETTLTALQIALDGGDFVSQPSWIISRLVFDISNEIYENSTVICRKYVTQPITHAKAPDNYVAIASLWLKWLNILNSEHNSLHHFPSPPLPTQYVFRSVADRCLLQHGMLTISDKICEKKIISRILAYSNCKCLYTHARYS